MLNFKCRKTLCSSLIQCHFDYSCSSWFPGVNKTLKDKLQIAQNKVIRFILNLKSRDSIKVQELAKAGFLNVADRVTQLKLLHVFKIKNKICPTYMTTDFNLQSDMQNRISTRASAHNFF